MDEFPFPEGTYVLARSDSGLNLRQSCADHIWKLVTSPQAVHYGCGFVQSAVCLFCGGAPTPMIDADWFAHKVNQFDVAAAFGIIAEATEHLASVKELLEAWWLNDGQPNERKLVHFE